MDKQFKLSAAQIAPLISPMGGCIATDRITVDGAPVGYMYREDPDNPMDSGWRFLAGDESEEYMSAAENHGIYDVNTIANYDPDIIPFLAAAEGSHFIRDESGRLVPDDVA